MDEEENINLRILKIAIIISIIIGIFVTVAMIITNNPQSERFSALYLVPGSYSNFPEENTIYFTYGVKSYEHDLTEYNLEIYIDDKLVSTRKISLDPGEIFQENVTLLIPETLNITTKKVKLILISPFSEYSTHFWVEDAS